MRSARKWYGYGTRGLKVVAAVLAEEVRFEHPLDQCFQWIQTDTKESTARSARSERSTVRLRYTSAAAQGARTL